MCEPYDATARIMDEVDGFVWETMMDGETPFGQRDRIQKLVLKELDMAYENGYRDAVQ